MKETEIAKSIVKWLIENKWEVYQEVAIGSTMRRADIIALNGNIIWTIETKTILSLNLISQAFLHLNYSNYVSIAVPSRRREGNSYFFINDLLKNYGIGLLTVTHNLVYERIRPKLRRNKISYKKYLCEEQKTFAEAGNSDNIYFTSFKRTVLTMKNYIEKHPGCTFKELLNAIDTHYNTTATAKACLSRYIDMGIIKGIKKQKNGKMIQLFLEDN